MIRARPDIVTLGTWRTLLLSSSSTLFRNESGIAARGVRPVSPGRARRAHIFAAEMKGIEEAWGEWLGKLEALLKGMEWTFATVHLETEQVGDHSYHWFADDPRDRVPVLEWRFEGGPREFSRP